MSQALTSFEIESLVPIDQEIASFIGHGEVDSLNTKDLVANLNNNLALGCLSEQPLHLIRDLVEDELRKGFRFLIHAANPAVPRQWSHKRSVKSTNRSDGAK